MPSAPATLVLANGAATPVNKTFTPTSVSTGLTSYACRTDVTMAAGQPTISFGFSPASAKRKTYRLDFSVKLPMLQSAYPGDQTVVGQGLVKGYFVIPDTMSADQRKDLYAFFANAWANASVKETVVSLEPLF